MDLDALILSQGPTTITTQTATGAPMVQLHVSLKQDRPVRAAVSPAQISVHAQARSGRAASGRDQLVRTERHVGAGPHPRKTTGNAKDWSDATCVQIHTCSQMHTYIPSKTNASRKPPKKTTSDWAGTYESRPQMNYMTRGGANSRQRTSVQCQSQIAPTNHVVPRLRNECKGRNWLQSSASRLTACVILHDASLQLNFNGNHLHIQKLTFELSSDFFQPYFPDGVFSERCSYKISYDFHHGQQAEH